MCEREKNPNIFRYFQENYKQYEAIKEGPSAIPVKSFVLYDCLPNTSPITVEKSCQDCYMKDKKFFRNYQRMLNTCCLGTKKLFCMRKGLQVTKGDRMQIIFFFVYLPVRFEDSVCVNDILPPAKPTPAKPIKAKPSKAS